MADKGTPLFGADDLDILEFVRTIAVARILLPQSMVRLSAGREHMSDAAQPLRFLAGTIPIFVGDTLLTTRNPDAKNDRQLLKRLGLSPLTSDG